MQRRWRRRYRGPHGAYQAYETVWQHGQAGLVIPRKGRRVWRVLAAGPNDYGWCVLIPYVPQSWEFLGLGARFF